MSTYEPDHQKQLKDKLESIIKFQELLDPINDFLNQYPENYVTFRKELTKTIKKNKMNIRYIEQNKEK